MTIYMPTKTYIDGGCFWSKSTLNSIDLSNTPFKDNSARFAFTNCYSLKSCQNMNSYVSDLNCCFSECNNLTTPPDFSNFYQVYTMRGAFSNCRYLLTVPSLPKQATIMSYCFENCIRLNNVSGIIPYGVINMYKCFYNCKVGNIDIHIPNSVTNVTSCFGSSSIYGNIYVYGTELSTDMALSKPSFPNPSPTRNIYIPFTYDNGVYTTTYNSYSSYYSSGSAFNIFLYDIKQTTYWSGPNNPWYQNSSTYHYGRVLPTGV